MRTKTLLIAAAALAAGILASSAQTYSQNIVGYVNVPTPLASYNYLLSCPFIVGVSNGVNEVFGNALPDFTQILTWDVPSQTYSTSLYDSTEPTPGVRWYQIDDTTPLAAIPKIPAGTGFFLLPSAPITNTFVGTVVVATGATNTEPLSLASYNYLVGSAIPYSGVVTNGAGTGYGVNLNGLPDFTQTLQWDVPSQSYVTSEYDSTEPTPGVRWYLVDDTTPTSVPNVNVGIGLFILPAASYNWVQVLPPN